MGGGTPTPKNDSDASLYDYSLFLVALLNVACHMAALFSRRLFDGPFFFAELNKVASYAIMLGAALMVTQLGAGPFSFDERRLARQGR